MWNPTSAFSVQTTTLHNNCMRMRIPSRPPAPFSLHITGISSRHLQSLPPNILSRSLPVAVRQTYSISTMTRLKLAGTASINTDEDTAEAARTIDTSSDPFQILGIDQPTADVKLIKRAYKRRALKFHPDVLLTQNSSSDEKKVASDRFAKINWAYQTLSGQRERSDTTYGSPAGSDSRSGGATGTSTGGWSPPHRRSGGAYSSSSSSSGTSDNPFENFSTDWRDYMPKTGDDEKYDVAGDSFEKIFSDLFASAATGAVGMAGTGATLFADFIDFLEGNVDGYSSGMGSSSGFGRVQDGDNDPELQVLLRTGSFDDVANEMDDTNLVVDQLRSKLSNLDDEILTVTAEAKMTTRYMEKIELEEQLAELNARKNVVSGYLKKSQKRLLALQTRYKELMTKGTNDSYAGGGRNSTGRGSSARSSTGNYSSSTASSYSSSSSTSSSRPQQKTTETDAAQQSKRPPRDSEDSWMSEGFGSTSSGRGRGRGSSRRRSRSTSTASNSSRADAESRTSDNMGSASSTCNASTSYTSTSSSQNYQRESVRPPPSSTSPSSSRSTSAGRPSPSSSRPSSLSSPVSQTNVPPHRRTSSYVSQQEADKKRMQEIKVDEEFEKLKRELGL